MFKLALVILFASVTRCKHRHRGRRKFKKRKNGGGSNVDRKFSPISTFVIVVADVITSFSSSSSLLTSLPSVIVNREKKLERGSLIIFLIIFVTDVKKLDSPIQLSIHRTLPPIPPLPSLPPPSSSSLKSFSTFLTFFPSSFSAILKI